ncbi:MAG: metalloregulator ArsR/SmtB family transcription factor [Actinobacteria bacterium]|nr:metalloregulator ArsR/SmtB family transcription factor [Actinomycetota bacterium]
MRPDELFTLLGDPTRFRIFEYISSRNEGCAAGKVAKGLRLNAPAVSQHLKILRDGGLLQSERMGRQIVYSLHPTARSKIGDSVGHLGGKSGRKKGRLSARNRLLGKVTKIERDAVTSAVTLDIGGQKVQAVITTDALDDLGLALGDPAYAVVKATEVMLMT